MTHAHPCHPGFILTGDCPRCSAPLVVRYARRDNQPFVGCDNYPLCRFTARYEEALAAAIAECHGDLDLVLEALRRTDRQLAEARRELEQWRSMAAAVPPLTPRALTQLLAIAHPDRWAQGQPASALAHEVTVAINALRQRLRETL